VKLFGGTGGGRGENRKKADRPEEGKRKKKTKSMAVDQKIGPGGIGGPGRVWGEERKKGT